MRVGAERLEIAVHGELDVAGAREGIPDALLQRLDAPALPEEAVPPASAKVGDANVGIALQALDLRPQLGLGPRVEHVEREEAVVLHRRARAQLVDDGERRYLPQRRVHPRTGKVQLVLAVD